jgi:CRISPR type IV-associated protein Csf3
MSEFKNLKITVSLKSPTMMDRFLTIDSILLGIYYRLMEEKNGKTPFVDSIDAIKFLDKKEGVLSGSIWYINPEQKISFDFVRYTKKPESNKIADALRSDTLKDEGGGEFKAGLFEQEVMATERIHFFVRGDKEFIERLLGELKFVGKKGAIGFGRVGQIFIEEIDSDKGHMLDENTPSKPLPLSGFKCDSKKVAFYRTRPPYWSNHDLAQCYMPTVSLYEAHDESGGNKKLSVDLSQKYISNVSFARACVKGKQGFSGFTIADIPQDRKKRWEIHDGEPLQCAVTGTMHPKGAKGNMTTMMGINAKNFTDQGHFQNNSFLSEDFLWSIKKDQLSLLGDSLITKTAFIHVQGKNKEEGSRFPDFIKEPDRLKPPFSLNVKTTANSQHVCFKGRVAISNGMFPMQLGTSTLFVDGDLLMEAIKEVRSVVAGTKEHGISRTHLVGNWAGGNHPELQKVKWTKESEKIIDDFQKKYDSAIRRLIFMVAELK